MYKVFSNFSLRVADSTTIPIEPENADYQAYLAYVAGGGEVESAVPDRKTQIWEMIKAERDRRKFGGVKVGNYWFHTDADSRTQQLSLVMLGSNIPPNTLWKSMGSQMVTMTPTLAQQIFAAVIQAEMTLFGKAEQLRALVNTVSDPDSVDIYAGWPPTYKEAMGLE